MQPMLNSFQRKHRQKMRARLLFQAILIAALFGTAYACYQVGVQQEAARIGQKAIELAAVAEERDKLRADLVNQQAKAVEDAKRIEEADRRYKAELPNETIRNFTAIIRDKLASGVSVERMNSILSASANPRNCRDRDVKRFMLSTAINQGTQSWAGFGNGAITVTGEGQSYVTPDKRPEAWFDPEKPVKMRFTLIGGKVSAAEGMLPLQHSIIDDNVEYRFTVSPGTTRGFIEITASTCDYP